MNGAKHSAAGTAEAMSTGITTSPVTADDLVPDRALEAVSEDRFKHRAIAERVADLVATASVPLNVGLFGPWGSGKSSLAGFLKEGLSSRQGGERVAFVYYDAWKYGGESLRRNFISRAAAELKLAREDPQHDAFYRGLYETRRRAEVKAGPLWKIAWPIIWRFAWFFALLNIIFALGLGAASILTDENFFGEIGRVLPKSLAGSGLVAVAVAAANALFATTKIDIEKAAPSADDEFSDTFRELIRVAREGPLRRQGVASWPRLVWGRIKGNHILPPPSQGNRPARIVFFVDELDRCSEEDVVTTLVAIRTFLDEHHCVFVVAADRAVLEAALDKAAQQKTPTNEDAPYYSTAGAFLDKIFQHQLVIPPLRGRRLTRFARDLVVLKQSGLWQELRDGMLLDDVIYALVPAHVRSPRRVKVLLNNFAVTARIAQSRGVAWPDRAQEIAKLTVLRAEFPALADDLYVEPRLPLLLLDPHSAAAQTNRAAPLVKRHSLNASPRDAATTSIYHADEASPQDAATFIDEDDDEANPGSESAKSARARHEEMRNRQRQELRRYLERTAEIAGPQRDLLYLEPAGAAVGLDDPELGDEIEDLAPDKPEEVPGLLQGRALTERLGAARLLADLIQDMVSKERTNVMTALTTLALDLAEDLTAEVAATVAKSVRVFLRQGPLSPEHLTGVLEIALRAAEEDLAETVLADDALWAEPERIETVALRWGQLPPAGQARLERETAGAMAEHASLLGTPLTALSETRALSVLSSADIQGSLKQAYSHAPEQLGNLVGAMLDAALQDSARSAQLHKTIALLIISQDPTYELLKPRMDEIAAALTGAERDGWLLEMWAAAPADDWGAWAELLGTPDPTSTVADRADAVLSRLFQTWDDVSVEKQSAITGYVRAMVPFAVIPEGQVSTFVAKLEEVLSLRWGTTEEAIESREVLHASAREALSIGGQTTRRIEQLLVDDLGSQLDEGGVTSIFDAVHRMATALSAPAIVQVAAHLRHHDISTHPTEATRELAVRAGLACDLKERGAQQWTDPALELSFDDEVRHVVLSVEAQVLLSRWLRLEPPLTAVQNVLKAYTRRPSQDVLGSLRGWAGERTRTERTKLSKTLLKEEANSKLIAALTTSEVVQIELARELASLVTTAGRSKQRRTFADKTAALGLESQPARQEVSDAALSLLREGRKGDIEVAVALVAGLGAEPPKQSALTREFATAADRHRYKFSGWEAETLKRSGVGPPKDSVGKKIRKRLAL